MKKMKVTCVYMGRSVMETVTALELSIPCTFSEMGEDVDKYPGLLFEDEDGPIEIGASPLTWKNGKATERGCGPWWGGSDLDTVLYCDELLKRVNLGPLILPVNVDNPTAINPDAIFDIDGPNAYLMDALDQAEWRLET